MYRLAGQLVEFFAKAVMSGAENHAPLSKTMIVSAPDLTQLLRPFVKPRDLSQYAHNKNGLQMATIDVLIAVREAMSTEHFSRYDDLQSALIMLDAYILPDNRGMIEMPREHLRTLRDNRQVIEDSAQKLRQNRDTIQDSVPLIRARLPFQLLDAMRDEITDINETANALIKLADNFSAFFNKYNPDLPQAPKPVAAPPSKSPTLRSPRPKFLGGVPRK